MKKCLLFLVLFTFYPFLGQETEEEYEVQKANSKNQTYYRYRTQKSIPPYNLSKIKNLISKLEKVPVDKEAEQNGDLTDYYIALSEKEFSKLTEKEKFTYTMIHPEYISQINEEKIFFLDENNKIFGNLPSTFDGANWSNQQREFLKSNREVVISLIKETVLKDSQIGLNYKIALEEINAVEIIPFLIDFYTTKGNKDKDILTLLMLLVKRANYHPFIRSNIFRELYGTNSTYESSIEYNLTNEEYIIKTATNFHVQIPKRR